MVCGLIDWLDLGLKGKLLRFEYDNFFSLKDDEVLHHPADFCQQISGGAVGGCRQHGGKLNSVHLHILPTL